MEITFKYKDKIISTPNLEKKLKRMKISIDDIEIMEEIPKQIDQDEFEEKDLYYFINKDNGYRHCSIYDECSDGYSKCTKKEYESNLWS